MTDAAKVAALGEALERLRDGVVAMKNAIPLQSLGPEWRPFLGRTGEVNQALDLADAALSASDSGEVAGLRADHAEGLTADMLAVEGAISEAMNRAQRVTRTLAALTRPVSETPEAAPSSETRRVLERLDRGVTRATGPDGKIKARTVHLFIADLKADTGVAEGAGLDDA